MQKSQLRLTSLVFTRTELAFLLLATLCSCGCQPAPPAAAKPLIGTWVLSKPEQLADRINQANVGLPRPEAETDESDPSSGGSKMMLEFRADGTLRTITDMGQLQQEKKGVWKFVSDAEAGKKLAIRCLLNQQTSDVEVEFIESDVISLVPPNMAGLNTKLTFRRTQ